MIPVKPYFLRAYFDWIVDNGWTPLVLVDATVAGVEVPQAYVKDGKIVLNLALRAIRNLEMDNDAVTFSTRFGGVAYDIRLPVRAVLAIYAEENGQILSFPPEPETEAVAASEPPPPGLPDVEDTPVPSSMGGKTAPPPRPARGRPALRIVKSEE